MGAALALFLSRCERDADRSAAPAEPSAPWPARPEKSATRRSRPVVYRVTERSRVDFDAGTRSLPIRGTFPIVDGRFTLDFDHPSRSRGSARIDVGAATLEGDAGARDPARVSEALNWLDLGSSRPEAERERLRFASFELEEIDVELSQDITPAGSEAGAEEVRRATFVARGALRLHDRRATETVRGAASLHYDGRDAARPTRIVVTTSQPTLLELETFDVAPRDAHGVLLAKELARVGRDIARHAKVALELELVPE
ncbi:MAG TPA: hypothetical protein VF989_12725 [Polyangiaceae bacterium]